MNKNISENNFQLGPDIAVKRIVVAMPGGAYSSVVASLAARSGAETSVTACCGGVGR